MIALSLQRVSLVYQLLSQFELGISDAKGRDHAIKRGLGELPPGNYAVAKKIFGFFHQVALHHEQSMMTGFLLPIRF